MGGRSGARSPVSLLVWVTCCSHFVLARRHPRLLSGVRQLQRAAGGGQERHSVLSAVLDRRGHSAQPRYSPGDWLRKGEGRFKPHSLAPARACHSPLSSSPCADNLLSATRLAIARLGCMNPITVIIPDGTILSPSEDAAVVGGNVLTSQRVTDVILLAFEACACSQVCRFVWGDVVEWRSVKCLTRRDRFCSC